MKVSHNIGSNLIYDFEQFRSLHIIILRSNILSKCNSVTINTHVFSIKSYTNLRFKVIYMYFTQVIVF